MRGIGLAALGFAVVSTADAAAKWVVPEVGVAAVLLTRGLVGAASVALLARGRGLRPRRRGLLAGRSLLHAGSSTLWYVAWMAGYPLADSYAVAAVVPLLMTLLAIPILGEQVGWRRWTATGVGFAGVLFMLQPGGDLWRPETGLLLVAVAAMGLTRTLSRLLARTDTPDAIAFWLLLAHVPVGLALLPVSALWPPGGWGVPSVGTLLALILFGAANGVAQMLFSRAFALAPVSALAPFEYTPLFWGVVLGFLLWREVPAWTTLGGVAVVIAAGLYTLHRERVRRAAERRGAPAQREPA